MTTELEKQFFYTFGIEPKYKDYRTKNGKIYDNKNPENRNIRLCYPQITDHHYLLMLAYLTCCDDQEFGIDETLLKEKILKDIMLEYEYESTAKEKGWDSFDGFRTKDFVQALFKEE